MQRFKIKSAQYFGIFLIMFAFSSCAASRGMTLETGTASWYGPNFHGKQTANGETYNQNELTAAHKTLPFNTVVKVTNLDNGKSVTVRINDRGPYVGRRVIDISRAAAERIEMIGPGTARVRIELVNSEQPISRNMEPEAFTVQLASYTRKSQADELLKKIRGSYIQQARVEGTTYFRVYSGTFKNQNDAEKHRRELARKGYEGFVKQVQN